MSRWGATNRDARAYGHHSATKRQPVRRNLSLSLTTPVARSATEWQAHGMCNRARRDGEPQTLFERFGANWATPRPMDNRLNQSK
jgi:hypothetical protein